MMLAGVAGEGRGMSIIALSQRSWGLGSCLRPPRSSVAGERGLNTSFLSLQCTLQILNHSAFSCLENLTLQRQTGIAWSSSAAMCPYTCWAWAASRATLPRAVVTLLAMAGFDKPLCTQLGSHLCSLPWEQGGVRSAFWER